jgi:hypothetical protein
MASSRISETAEHHISPSGPARNRAVFFFLLVSALYFLDTLLRTTLKTFWYDELYTVYLCRLPSFHATWTAVLNGADLNPPLFYLLTRWAQHFSGEGLIATRFPAIFGFWIFGVCLYFFVARRLGRICGLIAALTPWFTFAGYYAYEARPHGAVLAWCGLMLVCWQRSRSSARVRQWPPDLWLGGFFLCFLGALLTHVYGIFLAIPFLLVEADELVRRRRIHIATCAALLLAPCFVAKIYLRMTATYLAVIGVGSGGVHVHPYEVIQRFLITIFGPGLILLIIVLALLAWRSHQSSPSDTATACFTREELIVAIGLLLLPVFGVVVAKVTRGPYFDRYFLAATAGYAMLLAQVVASYGSRKFVARALLAMMLVFFASDSLIAAYCHLRHRSLDLAGPGNLVVFSPDPRDPFSRNASLVKDRSNLDILIVGHPDYLFFQYYASPELRRRLIYAAPDEKELFLLGYRVLSHWTGAGLQTTSFDEYFAKHRDFLLYEASRDDCPTCAETILSDGFTLRSIQRDLDGRLEHFSK